MNRRQILWILTYSVGSIRLRAKEPVAWVTTSGIVQIGRERIDSSVGAVPVVAGDVVRVVSEFSLLRFTNGSEVIMGKGAKVKLHGVTNGTAGLAVETGYVRFAADERSRLGLIRAGEEVEILGNTGIAGPRGVAQVDELDALIPARDRIEPIPPEFSDFRQSDFKPAVPSPSEP